MHELQCLISADGPAFERNANRIDFVLQDSRAQTGASHLGQQIVVKTRPAFRLRARHFCRINIKQVAISIAEVLARRTLQSVAGFSFESLASGQIRVVCYAAASSRWRMRSPIQASTSFSIHA